MRQLILCATGCWTGTPAETPKPLPKPTSCQIEERLVETAGRANLSFRNLEFAELAGPFVRLAVQVTGHTAHARVETELLELEGDLALDALPVRPKRPLLHDGWLELTDAKGRAAIAGTLRLELELPVGFQPSSRSVDLPCESLTFAARTDPYDANEVGDVWLPPGTATTLYRTPGSGRITTWTAPERGTDDPSEITAATELQRTGNFVKIRIHGPNAVIAWVAAAAIAVPSDNVYGGLLGSETGEMASALECPDRVPIYIRVDGRVVRVGTTKPDASLFGVRIRTGDVELQLGGDIHPFLEHKDVERCHYP